MRAIIQRVSQASVNVEGNVCGSIKKGLLVLLGIEDADSEDDVQWLAGKIIQLRIFNDANGIMNLSLKEVDGEILLVSQFTLFASTKKGNRPSYIRASKPDVAIPLYEKMIAALNAQLPSPVQTGIFGADMKVSLINDGPVTIFIDSRARE
jgi:D-tyrosyl-tRNA(Tyr) deacylase